MANVVVIGAGPMGLSAAHRAEQLGHRVTVLEAEGRPGGMAAHFDFDGLSLERYYHFCCRGDTHTFELLEELGLGDRMRWVTTRMGYYVDGVLHPFGTPGALLSFSPLRPIDRLRYAAMAFLATKRNDWSALDRVSAKRWITTWCGRRAYDKLWHPLLHLKFFEHADSISAAWVWQRVKRLGKSRRSVFSEELGYIEGGSQTLVDALVTSLESRGVRIRCGVPVRRIVVEGGHARGVELDGGERCEADAVVSTAPLPRAASMLVDDAPELAATYARFENVGVACVIHKLAKSVSPYFWVNVSDPGIDVPGFVELSNLRPLGPTIVYVPYYMPVTHEKFSWSDERLLDESFAYLRRVNPALTESDRLGGHVGRLRNAQPVCDVGFAATLPDARTPVAGLWVADTSFYYPEDRGVSESVGYARALAERVDRELR